MPRKKIELKNTIESLAILDHDGKVDKKLEPKLSKEELLSLFRGMLLARRYDERMLRLQRQGRIGTYGPALGQEAASLGPAFAITKDDWFVPSFREPAGMLWRGWPMSRLMLWWGGNEIGATPLDDMNDMPICVPVSSQIQYGAGIAWGLKLDGNKQVALAFVGDGGTSEGDFHEGVNCAAAFNLPMVIVVQNNQWAISLPRRKQTASETIAQKALAYGMNGIQADGNDILAMIAATREAVDRARSGGGPTLIEAVTYRLGVHTTADDPKKYRTEEEVEAWRCKDPLDRFWKYVQEKGVLNEKAREAMEEEIAAEISAAVEKSETYEADIMEPFDHCFEKMTPALKRQRAEFEAYLSNGGSNGSPHAASSAISQVH
ncbi:MAG TPA: pyruvate dehydrogenase (acetyl-transferring) E1 component subunit alpha [Phycisphaerae bacterium]|nr:pyruvate dehydrogenase (acetyl-transferring) E1 component subunit alpha [Phycisphaerae bacterium]HRW53046.1 pyruvate dehydrogenase (acetyl-transferring) E1 component subunit alpha [Phycisphaerae bacterium]